jgi:hypothetical protein
MSGILSIFALVLLAIAAGVAIYGIFGLVFGSSEDLKSAGVYRGKLDLSEVYRDPIGFEPHGSRDTFVPTEVDTMSSDEFIADLERRVNTDFMGVAQRACMKRALTMLVGACELLDQCVDRLPCDIDNEDLVNKVSNWLVRGHQD